MSVTSLPATVGSASSQTDQVGSSNSNPTSLTFSIAQELNDASNPEQLQNIQDTVDGEHFEGTMSNDDYQAVKVMIDDKRLQLTQGSPTEFAKALKTLADDQQHFTGNKLSNSAMQALAFGSTMWNSSLPATTPASTQTESALSAGASSNMNGAYYSQFETMAMDISKPGSTGSIDDALTRVDQNYSINSTGLNTDDTSELNKQTLGEKQILYAIKYEKATTPDEKASAKTEFDSISNQLLKIGTKTPSIEDTITQLKSQGYFAAESTSDKGNTT